MEGGSYFHGTVVATKLATPFMLTSSNQPNVFSTYVCLDMIKGAAYVGPYQGYTPACESFPASRSTMSDFSNVQTR